MDYEVKSVHDSVSFVINAILIFKISQKFKIVRLMAYLFYFMISLIILKIHTAVQQFETIPHVERRQHFRVLHLHACDDASNIFPCGNNFLCLLS